MNRDLSMRAVSILALQALGLAGDLNGIVASAHGAGQVPFACPYTVQKSTAIEFADALDDLAFESETEVHPGLLSILEWGKENGTSLTEHFRNPVTGHSDLAPLTHLELNQLNPDQWTSLIHALWDPVRFEKNRRVPFLKVKKQIEFPIPPPEHLAVALDILEKSAPHVVHRNASGTAYVVELARVLEVDNIHFQAPSAPEMMLELHFRFKLPELGIHFENLELFFRHLLPITGIQNPEAHLHVVNRLLRTRARIKSKTNSSHSLALAWTYWVKLVNQMLDFQEIRLDRTVDTVWDPKAQTIYYSNFKMPLLQYQQLKNSFQGGNPDEIGRILGHVSFKPHGSYDQPGKAGAEIRNIRWGARLGSPRTRSEYLTFALQKLIKESFQSEKALDWVERMSQWYQSVKNQGLDPFSNGLTWDHSELPDWRPTPGYRRQVGAIADDPLFQFNGHGSARAYFIKKKLNHSFELLFHDWCVDPLFFGKPECQGLYALQREALGLIRDRYRAAYGEHRSTHGRWSGRRLDFDSFIDQHALEQILAVQYIVQRFVREAKLLERTIGELD